MAGTTLRQYWDSRRWVTKEHGLQWLWNEVNQIINSQFGPAANTVISTVIVDGVAGNPPTEGATTIKSNGAGTNSGIFANSTGTAAAPSNAGGGQTLLRPDPGTKGGFGPIPTRNVSGGPDGRNFPTDGDRVP